MKQFGFEISTIIQKNVLSFKRKQNKILKRKPRFLNQTKSSRESQGEKSALPCVMKGGVADIRDDEPYHCASITDSHHYTALNCTDGRKFMSL